MKKQYGGDNGKYNGVNKGFVKGKHLVGAKLSVEVPIKIGSKAQWLLHCLGVMESTQTKNGKPGNNTPSSQFVTSGDPMNCGEYNKGCTAMGNTLAAIIGLYYYPDCDKPEYNWVITQERPLYHYNIRMLPLSHPL